MWDLQDLSPEPEMQVSDRTQALFKAVSGAALKSCSDRLTAQDTQSAVGSWGSHSRGEAPFRVTGSESVAQP